MVEKQLDNVPCHNERSDMQLPDISVRQYFADNINVVRNAKMGAGKMLKFDAMMSGPKQVVQCYLGCDGIGNTPRT
jgi:hypothetical protein